MQSLKIIKALVKKEFFQIFRDPSSIVIAFILPLISSLIYMYGLNLDTPSVTVGIKNDDANPAISTLIESFGNSQYVQSIVYDNEKELEDDIVRSKNQRGSFYTKRFFYKIIKRTKR
jgi:ABC-2 type transport system permease protein